MLLVAQHAARHKERREETLAAGCGATRISGRLCSAAAERARRCGARIR